MNKPINAQGKLFAFLQTEKYASFLCLDVFGKANSFERGITF